MKFDITLRTRLVMLVLAAMLPLYGLAVVGAVMTSDKAVSQARQNMGFSASLVAANQERVVASAHQILSAGNYHGKKRKNTVDAVAASLILEGYLSFLASQKG